MPAFRQAVADIPGLAELAAQRARVRVTQRAARKADNKELLATLGSRFSQFDTNLVQLTETKPDANKAVIEREKILKLLGDNRDLQDPFDTDIKKRGNTIQLYQKLDSLIGRILLAVLLVVAITRQNLLRLFLVPGLALFPVTYWMLYHESAFAMQWGILFCGLMVVAQFSYFGEYLPKVFPLHLRGTGGSFATNVGGRMIGTSAAFLTTNVIAPRVGGKSTFDQVAIAAGIVGTAVFVIALVATVFLPEPKEQIDEK